MPSLHSPGKIVRLELENFKSYKGHQVIGPFSDFTAIIGPNGAGKSNLMDAISFVLGVRTGQLRGAQLKDLIYALDDREKEQRGRTAFVLLVYKLANNSEIQFKRTITAAGASEYRFNGNVVTWDVYNSKLKALGILVKARNFLVFQGDVESIASKNPKELSGLIEQICGSDELKKDYEEFEEKKAAAEEKLALAYQKKKTVVMERKQKKEQKEEAEKHLRLQDQLQPELLKLKEEMARIKTKIKKGKKEEQKRYAADIAKLQRDIQDLEAKMEDLQKKGRNVGDQLKLDGDDLEEYFRIKHTLGDKSFGANQFGASVTYSNFYNGSVFGLPRASGVVTQAFRVGFGDILNHTQSITRSSDEVHMDFPLEIHGNSNNTAVRIQSRSPKEIFLQALRDFISERCGVLEEGWQVEFRQSESSSELYAVYCAPDGKIFDSVVACYLGLTSGYNSMESEIKRERSLPSLGGPHLPRKRKPARALVANGFVGKRGALINSNCKDYSSDGLSVECAGAQGTVPSEIGRN